MRVGVVISTLGKSSALGLVLESLSTQTHAPQQVVVVDQSEGSAVADLVSEWEDRLPVTRLTSSRGVSLGRNTGWQALEGCDVVAFPDDDITLETGTLAAVAGEFEADPTMPALSGRLTGSGPRIAFEGGREYITRRGVWTKAIESTTFYRLEALRAVGGFNVTLGVGCATQWQSGEGSDLLLRVMDLGPVLYEPSIVVREHQDPIAPADYLRKVRKYARGTGRVYRTRYGVLDCTLVVVRPVVAAAVYIAQGRRAEAHAKWQAAVGRIEGMMLPATARPAS